MSETRFWLLRHAPVNPPPGVILGTQDVPCDVSDGARMTAIAHGLPENAVLVESGIARCRQTVEALRAAGASFAEAKVEPDLAEQFFGDWQGRRWEEIDRRLAEPFWASPARTRPPGGESFEDVMRRVGAALDRLAADCREGDIVAVAHAGSIRAAVATALDLAPEAALRLEIAPLSLTRLDLTSGGWRIVCVGCSG